jgi:CxxC motif-containing protein
MTGKVITCITCPLGCAILVRGEGDRIDHIEGNRCKRGEDYAKNEYRHPVRILTTTVKVENAQSSCPLAPVRSDKPIPKELLLQCMAEIQALSVAAPVAQYDVLIADILGTGANILATAAVQ